MDDAISIRLDDLQTMKYEGFLGSPEWAIIRQAAIERAGGRCQVCNTQDQVTIHHRSYEDGQWGRLRLANLVVLCRPCHEIFHAAGRAVTGNEVSKTARAQEQWEQESMKRLLNPRPEAG